MARKGHCHSSPPRTHPATGLRCSRVDLRQARAPAFRARPENPARPAELRRRSPRAFSLGLAIGGQLRPLPKRALRLDVCRDAQPMPRPPSVTQARLAFPRGDLPSAVLEKRGRRRDLRQPPGREPVCFRALGPSGSPAEDPLARLHRRTDAPRDLAHDGYAHWNRQDANEARVEEDQEPDPPERVGRKRARRNSGEAIHPIDAGASGARAHREFSTARNTPVRDGVDIPCEAGLRGERVLSRLPASLTGGE